MNSKRIKNKILQAMYRPSKSKILNSENLKVFDQIENELEEKFTRKKKKVGDNSNSD